MNIYEIFLMCCGVCSHINDNEIIDGPNKRPYRYKPIKLKNEKFDNWRCCCKCHKPGLFKWYSNAGKYSFSRFCRDCAEKVAQEEKIFLVGWDMDKFLDAGGQHGKT